MATKKTYWFAIPVLAGGLALIGYGVYDLYFKTKKTVTPTPPTSVNMAISIVIDAQPTYCPNPTGWIPYWLDTNNKLYLPDEGAAVYLPLSSVYHFTNIPGHGYITVSLINAAGQGTEFGWQEVFLMNQSQSVVYHVSGEVGEIVP